MWMVGDINLLKARELVFVETRVEVGRDSLNAPVFETVEVKARVLVAPGPRSDIKESNRPEGKLVKYTLHFPKTWTIPLEGLRIKVRGSFYKVVGVPDHYMHDLTPGPFSMPVEVEAAHG
jgi:hypothetical protein